MSTSCTILDSPFGEVLVAWSGRGLERVFIGAEAGRRVEPAWRVVADLDCPATRQLREYFEGSRRTFDLPLVLEEGSAFRRRVWQALGDIPYGETVTYGEMAARVGSPNGSRAVGMACGANPLPIVLPCHRVVGSGGRLVGFGGGIAMKAAMLEFERAIASPQGALLLEPLPRRRRRD